MSYTPSDARKEFTSILKRSSVLLLGQRFGVSPSTTRKLIENGDIKPIRYPNQTRAHYELENCLTALLPQ